MFDVIYSDEDICLNVKEYICIPPSGEAMHNDTFVSLCDGNKSKWTSSFLKQQCLPLP